MGKTKGKVKDLPAEVIARTKRKVHIKCSARLAEKESAIVALKKDSPSEINGRRLDRRNTEQVSSRSIRLKLGMFPRSQIDGNVDDAGKTIDTKVKEKIRALRGTRRHIPVAFWRELIVEHRLSGNLCGQLKPPEDREAVDKDLDAALKAAHHDNPALKSNDKITRWLEWRQEPLNTTEMYGLLVGSMEAPSLSAKSAKIIQEALLTCIAQTKANETFKEYWLSSKEMFDMILVDRWRKASSDGVSRRNFLRAHRLPLSLFIDMTTATEIEKVLDQECDPGMPLLKGMMSSTIGGELYLPEVTKCEVTLFLSDISKRIFEVEQQNFDPVEIRSFERIMMHSAANLDADISQAFDKCETKITFCASELGKKLDNINDLWGFRWIARYKTIAISNNQGNCRTSWERLLWGDSRGAIEHVPQEIAVPEDLLFDSKNCREHLDSLLGGGWHSVSRMREIVNANQAQLTTLDKSFWMEIDFLNHHFDELLQEHLRACLLAALPEEHEVRSMPKAIVAARTLATGQVATAAGKETEQELISVVNLLSDVADGKSPPGVEIAKMSEFHILCLKKAENFCVVKIDVPVTDSQKVRRKQLIGAAALDAVFSRSQENKSGPDNADLKVMRQFRWMLTPKMNSMLDDWIRDAVINAKDRMVNQRKEAIEDIEKREKNVKTSALVAVARPAITAPGFEAKTTAASSSSACRPASPVLQAEPVLKAKKRFLEESASEEESLCEGSAVMSFFGSKAM